MTNNDNNFLIEYSRFLDSSAEHFTYTALSMYRNYSSALSRKEIHFFKKHLETCNACSVRLQEVAEVEEDGAAERPKNFLTIIPVEFRYAAAAVLLTAIGISVFFIWQGVQHETIPSSEDSSGQIIAETTLDPARFMPNQTLEAFIERTTRSSPDASLLAPKSGDTLTQPVGFKWRGRSAVKTFTLTVVDNNNVQVWKKTTTALECRLGQSLMPGLYYVKLEAGEKLAQVGKFVVIR